MNENILHLDILKERASRFDLDCKLLQESVCIRSDLATDLGLTSEQLQEYRSCKKIVPKHLYLALCYLYLQQCEFNERKWFVVKVDGKDVAIFDTEFKALVHLVENVRNAELEYYTEERNGEAHPVKCVVNYKGEKIAEVSDNPYVHDAHVISTRWYLREQAIYLAANFFETDSVIEYIPQWTDDYEQDDPLSDFTLI